MVENLRKRKIVKFVTSKSEARRLAASDLFNSVSLISENMLQFSCYKPSILLNRPLPIGVTVLDSAKLKMYQFWYDVIKKNYGDRATLCYTDTDSFIFELKSKFLEKDLDRIKKYLDFSNFPKNHSMYNVNNCGKLGFFKVR